MNKKEEKNLIINIFLIIIAVILIATCIILILRHSQKNESAEKEVELKEVGYETTINHYGYKDAKGVVDAFMSSYEHLSGEQLASMMNLGATYVFNYIIDGLKEEGVSEENIKEEAIKRFDDKYVEIMKNPSEFENFVLMQYVMKDQEQNIINGMPATVPNMVVIGDYKIEDLTKYLSKIDLNVSVTSEVEGISEIDTLELLLLHKNETYYLMSFDRVSSVNLE